MKVSSYKNLVVWQKAAELSVTVYELTKYFPKEEMVGLTSQIRRAVMSIPANIAEGRSRGTRKQLLQFMKIAYSSSAKLESHLEIAKRLPKTNNFDYSKVDSLLKELMKMLTKMIYKLES